MANDMVWWVWKNSFILKHGKLTLTSLTMIHLGGSPVCISSHICSESSSSGSPRRMNCGVSSVAILFSILFLSSIGSLERWYWELYRRSFVHVDRRGVANALDVCICICINISISININNVVVVVVTLPRKTCCANRNKVMLSDNAEYLSLNESINQSIFPSIHP